MLAIIHIMNNQYSSSGGHQEEANLVGFLLLDVLSRGLAQTAECRQLFSKWASSSVRNVRGWGFAFLLFGFDGCQVGFESRRRGRGLAKAAGSVRPLLFCGDT